MISLFKELKNQQENRLELHFNYLPLYAAFLLENKMHEFVKQQILLSKEIKLPLLKYLENFSEEQLIVLGLQTTEELLKSLRENRAAEYIKFSTERWLSNQLPSIAANQVIIDDILLLSLVRRKIFRHFIPTYTNNLELAIKILNEIDIFTVKTDTLSFKTFSEIQKQIFTQAQALAHIGSWQWDLRTKKLSWSNEIYNIYELEPQSELVSENIALYNHPDDAGLIDRYMRLSAETLSPHDFYYRIILKDGRQKILHAKGEIKLDRNKTPVEMFGTLQDVTEQKKHEKELEDNRKFIEKITNVSPCIITVYNKNSNNYIFVNSTVKRLLGYTPEEFIDNGRELFYSLVHPEDVQMVKEKNVELINESDKIIDNTDEKVKEVNYRFKHKNV